MQDKDTAGEIEKMVADDILKTAQFCIYQINKSRQRGLELCKIRSYKRLEHYDREIGKSSYRKIALKVCGDQIKKGEEDIVKIIIAFVLVV